MNDDVVTSIETSAMTLAWIPDIIAGLVLVLQAPLGPCARVFDPSPKSLKWTALPTPRGRGSCDSGIRVRLQPGHDWPGRTPHLNHLLAGVGRAQPGLQSERPHDHHLLEPQEPLPGMVAWVGLGHQLQLLAADLEPIALEPRRHLRELSAALLVSHRRPKPLELWLLNVPPAGGGEESARGKRDVAPVADR